MNTEQELEEILSRPSPETVKTISKLKGDIIILGISGKMGPTLAKLVKRAINEAGVNKKVIGVARFSSPESKKDLEKSGIETITCDLLDEEAVNKLPDVPNVVFMAGMKFGSTGNESLTWAINCYLPAIIAKKYRNSKIIAFSTGNVYTMMPFNSKGSKETDTPGPNGEYAQSCLGRERIFQYFSSKYKTPVVLIRLNYANELRYGVLLDIAQKVYNKKVIDLSMGYANIIWQGDANNITVQSFDICKSPANVLNMTGAEILSVRYLANRFGKIFNRKPVFKGKESKTALLSNTEKCRKLFGPAKISVEQMIQWVAHWVRIEGTTINKPTHFQNRDGKF
ncbi:MAG: epimerase [Elusimicrobia bacterium RIFOXYD2_FULL_34_15]|nr:MAG: epimerase [Elusimicrobia bacterium RIFOXYD2_FULL_34_15]